MASERRQHPRVVVACPAKVFDRRRRLLVKGKTVDISAGGVKILGPAVREPEAGAEVEIEMNLLLPNAQRPRQVQRRATIRRVEPMGDWTSVALQFGKDVDMTD